VVEESTRVVVYVSHGCQTSYAMAAKVLQTTSQVFMCSLLWVQHKRWTPTTSMGCVHNIERYL
jgi:hydrogenase maturation factor